MPAHTARAAITDSTVIASPEASREAKETQPTSTANAACMATINCTRPRPCATLAHTKLTTLEKAGAPETSATARLTATFGATPAKCCLTSTAAVAPSTSPSVKPNSPQGRISRRKLPSASALGLTGGPCGTAGKLTGLAGTAGGAALTSRRPVCSYRDIRIVRTMTPTAAATPLDAAPHGAPRPLLLVLPLLLLLSGAQCGALANA